MKKHLFFFLSGIIVLIIVIADIIWWIYVSADDSKSWEEAQSAYLAGLPDFIQTGIQSTWYCIGLLVIASSLFALASATYKRAGEALMILSILLLGWQLFSLM